MARQTFPPAMNRTNQATNQRAGWGRSIYPLLRFTASLGSVTDTLHYNWYCAYANEFTVAVEYLDVRKVKAIVQDATGLYEGA
jgi:hypothetical protein